MPRQNYDYMLDPPDDPCDSCGHEICECEPPEPDGDDYAYGDPHGPEVDYIP